MKWVGDTTGRFDWRPYYEEEELNSECEQIVTAFLKAKNGAVRFPISTDDLSVLIEQDASDLDLYADLSRMGEDVEGVTEFFPNRKPAVRIARELSLDDRRQTRLRTTLAHEYGHVKFHAFLWDTANSVVRQNSRLHQMSSQRARYKSLREKLNSGSEHTGTRHVSLSFTTPLHNRHAGSGPRCRRTAMFDAPFSDWMEWQAGYVGGAILMPASFVRSLVRRNTVGSSVSTDPSLISNLTSRMAEAFDISAEAARVRLTSLGIAQNTAQISIDSPSPNGAYLKQQ